jgi:hypothetical protein
MRVGAGKIKDMQENLAGIILCSYCEERAHRFDVERLFIFLRLHPRSYLSVESAGENKLVLRESNMPARVPTKDMRARQRARWAMGSTMGSTMGSMISSKKKQHEKHREKPHDKQHEEITSTTRIAIKGAQKHHHTTTPHHHTTTPPHHHHTSTTPAPSQQQLRHRRDDHARTAGQR